MDFDLFISHASEDKDSFVRMLAAKLESMGLRVWYDEFSLFPGDSLHQSIGHGLSRSKYAVVVISDSFIQKKWTNWELNGLVQRHLDADYPVIIPVWHDVSANKVREFSPSLADIVALNSETGIDGISERIHQVIRRTKYAYSETPVFDIDFEKRISESATNRINVTVKRITSLISELFNYKVSLSALLMPIEIDGELSLKPFCFVGIDGEIEAPAISAKKSIYGMGITQGNFIQANQQYDGKYRGALSLEPQIQSMIVIPIKLPTKDGGNDVVGILSLNSEEKATFGQKDGKKIEEIVSLALEPIFSMLVSSKEIALTRQSSRRANARA